MNRDMVSILAVNKEGYKMKNRKTSKYICSLLFVFFICILWGCAHKRQDVFTSPKETNTVIIKYDDASRPSVFYEGEKIWEYPNSGFTEAVFFYVEWESEDSFFLKYDDESHDGKYAEEYLIELKK